MSRVLTRVAVVLAVLSLASMAWVVASPTRIGPEGWHPPPLPNSMAVVGDSISRAFDVGWSSALRDDPTANWATGTHSRVVSHYQRILAAHPAIIDRAYDFAETGAGVGSVAGQLAQAAAMHVQYVAVLIGANDLCASRAGQIPPVEQFASTLSAAFARFHGADPDGYLFVASIPDLDRLWATEHGNPRARAVWAAAGICPAALASPSAASRAQLRAAESAYNQALESACAAAADWCRWDGYAVNRTAFRGGDVSDVDYFHPSVRGQRLLADVTWQAGYWPRIG